MSDHVTVPSALLKRLVALLSDVDTLSGPGLASSVRQDCRKERQTLIDLLEKNEDGDEDEDEDGIGDHTPVPPRGLRDL